MTLVRGALAVGLALSVLYLGSCRDSPLAGAGDLALTLPEKVFNGVLAQTVSLPRRLRRDDLQQENRRLKEQVVQLELQVSQLRARLKIDESGGGSPPYLSQCRFASVVARPPDRYYDFVIVDQGGADGIVEGMGAAVGEGLVGYVTIVKQRHSWVQLITAQDFAVGVFSERSLVTGVLQGRRQEPMTMQYVPVEADVKVGDLLLTSSYSGLFPKGLPAAVVTGVSKEAGDLTWRIEATPRASLFSLHRLCLFTREDAAWPFE